MKIINEREKWVMKFKDTVNFLDASKSDGLKPTVSSDIEFDFPVSFLRSKKKQNHIIRVLGCG